MRRNTPQVIGEAHLGLLSEMVTSRLGLHCPQKRRGALRKAALAACRDLGHEDAEAWISRLVESAPPQEAIAALVAQLTVGETYFFRNRSQLEDVERHVLEPLVKKRAGRAQRLRIMSAGCATGEEPYTLAMILDGLLPGRTGWDVRVLGVDVNGPALEKARQGVYGKWSFRAGGLPLPGATSNFIPAGKGRYQVAPALREMVAFRRLNLAEADYPSPLNGTAGQDLVMCCNVLMYLAPKMATGVVRRLHDCLAPGGCLVVTPCETRLVDDDRLGSSAHVGIFFRDAAPAPDRRPLSPTVPGTSPPQAPWFSAEPSPATRGPVAPEAAPPAPPVREEASAPAGQGHYQAGRFALAVSEIEELVSRDPATLQTSGWPQMVALLAEAYANLKAPDKAREVLLHAIGIDKLNPWLRFLLASLLLEQGLQAEAREEFLRAIYLDERFVLAHFMLGHIALAEGRKDAARRYFANVQDLTRGMARDALIEGAGGLTAGSLEALITSLAEAGKE